MYFLHFYMIDQHRVEHNCKMEGEWHISFKIFSKWKLKTLACICIQPVSLNIILLAITLVKPPQIICLSFLIIESTWFSGKKNSFSFGINYSTF